MIVSILLYYICMKNMYNLMFVFVKKKTILEFNISSNYLKTFIFF